MPNFGSSAISNFFFRTGVAGHKKRQTYLIDKKAQLRIAGEYAVVMLAGSVLLFANLHLVNLLSYYSSVDSVPVGSLGSDGFRLWTFFALLIVVNMAVVMILALLFSHRVAGPAYQIVRALESIAKGDLTTIVRLRKKDHLKAIGEAVNAAVVSWRGTLNDFDKQLQSLKEQAGQLDETALREKLDAMEVALKRLNHSGGR